MANLVATLLPDIFQLKNQKEPHWKISAKQHLQPISYSWSSKRFVHSHYMRIEKSVWFLLHGQLKTAELMQALDNAKLCLAISSLSLGKISYILQEQM